jgi:hypothetical protein
MCNLDIIQLRAQQRQTTVDARTTKRRLGTASRLIAGLAIALTVSAPASARPIKPIAFRHVTAVGQTVTVPGSLDTTRAHWGAVDAVDHLRTVKILSSVCRGC